MERIIFTKHYTFSTKGNNKRSVIYSQMYAFKQVKFLTTERVSLSLLSAERFVLTELFFYNESVIYTHKS